MKELIKNIFHNLIWIAILPIAGYLYLYFTNNNTYIYYSIIPIGDISCYESNVTCDDENKKYLSITKVYINSFIDELSVDRISIIGLKKFNYLLVKKYDMNNNIINVPADNYKIKQYKYNSIVDITGLEKIDKNYSYAIYIYGEMNNYNSVEVYINNKKILAEKSKFVGGYELFFAENWKFLLFIISIIFIFIYYRFKAMEIELLGKKIKK